MVAYTFTPCLITLVDKMLAADHLRISAPTLVETNIVVTARKRSPGRGEVEGPVLARDTLLFVRGDFSRTDTTPA